jgi:hypothetical protein
VPIEDLLQMMGRAGRGDRTDHAVAIVRLNEIPSANELARALREEELYLPSSRTSIGSWSGHGWLRTPTLGSWPHR